MRGRRLLALALALAPAVARGNGRPPATTSVHFKPGDAQALYVGVTFGLLASPDGCRYYWICEDNIGIGGEFDPVYALTPAGTILATTFHGLRVSRDGGCSFSTATAQLPPSDPGNISALYLVSMAVGPSGDVWVGTSETGSANHVFRSTDDAATFAARGALPATNWFTSIQVAPQDGSRVYVTGFQVSGTAADGGTMPPSAHLYRSDDTGATWTELALAGVQLASSPGVIANAVGATKDVVFVTSQGANPPSGDRLYRSTDAGVTLAEVLATTDPIRAVVVGDAQTVYVATQLGGAFASSDGGATFHALANPPQLACLGRRGDGALFGCGANGDPDHEALARSTDAATWTRALQLQYITGPLQCPVGTAEHDICDQQLWRSLAQQLGVVAATCGGGPDGVADAPPVDGPAKKSRGCCDAGGGPTAGWAALVVLIVARRRRR